MKQINHFFENKRQNLISEGFPELDINFNSYNKNTEFWPFRSKVVFPIKEIKKTLN